MIFSYTDTRSLFLSLDLAEVTFNSKWCVEK